MIVYKEYLVKDRKTGDRLYWIDGWFLFGVIPLYTRKEYCK